MTQQQLRRNGASSAWLWGGIFGIVVVMLNVINRLAVAARVARALRPALRPGAGVALVSILLVFAVLACYFVAGLLAARRAGRVERGIFAGLIAGGIAGLGTLALVMLGTAMARHGLRVGIVGGIGGARIFVSTLASAVVGMVTSAIVGTGLGALGALVGRPRGGATAVGSGGYPYQAVGPSGFAARASAPSEASYPERTPPSSVYSAGDDAPTVSTGAIPPEA